jgi:hypothetical protein
MTLLKEDKSCYDGPVQREVLLALLQARMLPEGFFLTGGTALSVWYCHHRVSNDLDFFSRDNADLAEIDFALARRWPGEAHKIRQSPMLLTYLIRGTKIDIVIDPLSFEEERPAVEIESGSVFRIDTARSIASNKLTAMASRTEPKDFIDYFHMVSCGLAGDFDTVFHDARLKDAMFDDPATAAYAIESNYHTILHGALPLPVMRVPLDAAAWKICIDGLVQRLYATQAPPRLA